MTSIDGICVMVYNTVTYQYTGAVMLKFLRVAEGRYNDGHKLWVCQCECGDVSEYIASRVRYGRVSNCRKCASAITATKIRKHGMKYSDEYRIWGGIKTRCTNVNAPDFNRYGGAGVTMCEEWINSFESFFNHVGKRPSKEHSIDRIDNSKGYEPGNVRWATRSEQGRNRSVSTYVTDGTSVYHINDVAEKLNITRGAAHLRLKRGKLDGFTRHR